MISDPVVTITCDECGDTEERGLTVTGRGWDDRGLEDELRGAGWLVENDGALTICPDCMENRREAEEAAAEARRAETEWQKDQMAWGPGEGYGYA